MQIIPDRISQDIETIAGFNETTANIGYSRPTFSPAWRKARDYVISEVEAAGCKVRIDAAGNVHARHASLDWNNKVWLSGSHIDSVPTGGKFDGVMGIVCPLEVLRAAHATGKVLPLELIIFAEEEGTTFGIGMIGSRLWVNRDACFDGAGDDNFFNQFRNLAGQTYFEAGAAHGVRREALVAERLDPTAYRGLIEIHAEQGPALWAENVPLAAVTAIAGRRQYVVTLSGVPNHAGSTPMRFRADPLVAAARMITKVSELARMHGPDTVATVGRIECQPNAVNVIPGSVRFTIDLRCPRVQTLETCHLDLEQLITAAGANEFSFLMTEDQPPTPMDAGIVAAIQRVGNALPSTVSGALHDAAIVAPVIPTAMLFVASQNGISHNPIEFSRVEDIAAAAEILAKVVGAP